MMKVWVSLIIFPRVGVLYYLSPPSIIFPPRYIRRSLKWVVGLSNSKVSKARQEAVPSDLSCSCAGRSRHTCRVDRISVFLRFSGSSEERP